VLAPNTQATLDRVLQEMLTNAIKHGEAGHRILVLRTWAATSYTLSVSNIVRSDSDRAIPAETGGMGLDNMRTRLQQIDGTLEVSHPRDEDSRAFTATARIPLPEGHSRP
jgi:signal transduction histidine kinase